MTNAYQTPESIEAATLHPVALYWFIGAMFLALILGGMIGATGGALIGSVAPGYYRSVVINGDEPSFDPFEFGIGVGAVQGAGVGLLIGMVSIVAFVWCRSRKSSVPGSL